MSMQIEDKIVEDLDKFQWEKWRAITINKEKRKDGDYYFARLVRNYSEKDSDYDYDLGLSRDEQCKIGRIIKFVGERILDVKDGSPTFGKRIFLDAKTEEIEYLDRGEKKKKTVLKTEKGKLQGKRIWGYNIPDTPENTKKMQGLVGSLSMTKYTNFTVLKGNQNAISVDEKSFFSKTVDTLFDEHFNKLDGKKNETKK